MKGFPHFDILLSVVALVASLVLTAQSFLLLRAQEQPALLPVATLELGKNKYHVQLGERCVGSFHSSLEADESSVLVIQGELRLATGNERKKAAFSIQAAFNPLGQLYNSLSNLRVASLGVTVTSQQVKPINLEITMGEYEASPKFKVQVGGPVALIKERDGSYTLRYPQRRVSPSRALEEWGAQILERGKLEIVKSDAPCQGDAGIPLDGFQGLATMLPFGSLTQ